MHDINHNFNYSQKKKILLYLEKIRVYLCLKRAGAEREPSRRNYNKRLGAERERSELNSNSEEWSELKI